MHKPTKAAAKNIQSGRPDRATPAQVATAKGITKPDPAFLKKKGRR